MFLTGVLKKKKKIRRGSERSRDSACSVKVKKVCMLLVFKLTLLSFEPLRTTLRFSLKNIPFPAEAVYSYLSEN